MAAEKARNERKSVTHVHAQSVTNVLARCREGECSLTESFGLNLNLNLDLNLNSHDPERQRLSTG